MTIPIDPAPPFYTDGAVTLHKGDCLDVLPTIADSSIDAVVCDPPYELGFMGKAWDASGIAYNADVWRQCWRVLKPGGHLVAFGGTRTYHRMTVAIEDAGFEIRDSLHWIYGSGFPKSLNVAKAIEAGGGRPEDIRRMRMGADHLPSGRGRVNYDPGAGSAMDAGAREWAPTTDDAALWQGWGTALKPAHEPIVLARKPLAGTVAANVLEHGAGALNVDATRTATADSTSRLRGTFPHSDDAWGNGRPDEISVTNPAGRWPTNVLLAHPPLVDVTGQPAGDACADGCVPGCPVGELGTQARFFPVFRYQAKAPKSERPRLADGTAHSTVKPLALIRWLVRLMTPPGGTVLDPFAGSGTTLEACVIEGFRAVGIEREEPHAQLCRVRLARTVPDEPCGTQLKDKESE